jgi:hypothetical protein
LSNYHHMHTIYLGHTETKSEIQEEKFERLGGSHVSSFEEY